MIIILYLLILYSLLSTYLKLHGKGRAAIEFQHRIGAQIQASRLLKSTKEFNAILLVGIVGDIVLIAWRVYEWL